MKEYRPSAQAGGTIIGCIVASGMIGFATAAFTSGPAATIGGAAVIGAVGLVAAAVYGWSWSRPAAKQQEHQRPISGRVIVVSSGDFNELKPLNRPRQIMRPENEHRSSTELDA